jgi:UDP-N-acetylmuramoyl-L-alanyl-D-glutamate--2,6-diaminopimelate ligase
MMAPDMTQSRGLPLDRMLAGLVAADEQSFRNVDYLGLCADSRQVRAGDVFFALSGTRPDGGAFINMALDRGAVAVPAHTADSRSRVEGASGNIRRALP